MRALYRELERLPGEIDFNEHPGPSYQSYFRRYDGLERAYGAAGLLTFNVDG